MIRHRIRFARLSLLGLSLFVLARPSAGETITVSAAASLTDAIREIGKAYEAASSDRIEFNLGASNMLARQIEEGAPVDLFVSADERSMDQLDKKDLLAAGTRSSILSNTLAIVVETGSALVIDSPRALASERVHSIALAGPASVPAGIYAKQYLEGLGIWEAVKPKVIPAENVRAALATVESGNADAAIVYTTDAKISRKVRIAFQVPADQGPKISYAVAAVRQSRHGEAARKFLAFLESRAASEIFLRYGFLPKP